MPPRSQAANPSKGCLKLPQCHPVIPHISISQPPSELNQKELTLPHTSLLLVLSCSPSPSGEHSHLPKPLIRKKLPSRSRLASCKCMLEDRNPRVFSGSECSVATSQLYFVSFPCWRGFFSWTWPVSPRENHPAPSSDCLLAANTGHR